MRVLQSAINCLVKEFRVSYEVLVNTVRCNIIYHGRINYALLRGTRFGNYRDDRDSVQQVDFTPDVTAVACSSVRKLEAVSFLSVWIKGLIF